MRIPKQHCYSAKNKLLLWFFSSHQYSVYVFHKCYIFFLMLLLVLLLIFVYFHLVLVEMEHEFRIIWKQWANLNESGFYDVGAFSFWPWNDENFPFIFLRMSVTEFLSHINTYINIQANTRIHITESSRFAKCTVQKHSWIRFFFFVLFCNSHEN